MLEPILYARLTSDPTLSALVQGRIYPTAPPENVEQLPALVYMVTSADPMLTLTAQQPNLIKFGVDVTCYAVDLSDVLEVQEAVMSLLHGWRSDPVQCGFLTGQSTGSTDPGYQGMQSFTIWATPEGSLVVAQGADATVTLRDLHDDAGPIEDATVTGQLGDGLFNFSMPHTTNGTYVGTIPGATTDTLTPGRYTVTVTAITSSGTLTLQQPLRII